MESGYLLSVRELGQRDGGARGEVYLHQTGLRVVGVGHQERIVVVVDTSAALISGFHVGLRHQGQLAGRLLHLVELAAGTHGVILSGIGTSHGYKGLGKNLDDFLRSGSVLVHKMEVILSPARLGVHTHHAGIDIARGGVACAVAARYERGIVAEPRLIVLPGGDAVQVHVVRHVAEFGRDSRGVKDAVPVVVHHAVGQTHRA